MEKPTRVCSPACEKYSRRPRSASPSRARISAGEEPTRAPTSPALGTGRPLDAPVRPAPPTAPRPSLPASPAPSPPSVPLPASSGSPRSAGYGRGAQRRGAYGHAPALPQRFRGLCGASSRAAATRRLPRRARRNRAPRAARRARSAAAQALALGPAHAPAVARLLPAPVSPSTGERSAAAAPALSTLTGVWRASREFLARPTHVGICPARQNRVLKKP